MNRLWPVKRPIGLNLPIVVGIPILLSILIGLIAGRFSDVIPADLSLIVTGGCIVLLLLGPVLSWIVLDHPYLVAALYAADMHKVLLNVLPLLWGQPRAWDAHTQTVDYVAATITVVTLLLAILRGKARWRRWLISIPVVSQLFLTGFKLVGVLQTPTSLGLLDFAQFVGGNLLLLMMPVAVCQDDTQVRRVWKVWLITALILTVLSVWLVAGAGATWKGARERLVGLAGTRTGRVCVSAIIYLIISESGRKLGPWKKLLRWLTVVLFVIPVFSSHSKASLIGLVIVLGLYAVFRPGRFAGQMVLLGLFIVGLGLFLFIQYPGIVVPLIEMEGYETSIGIRVDLAQRHLDSGLASPFLGLGITGARPHNVFVELLVQVGIWGPVLFLGFFVSTMIRGWYALRIAADDESGQGLIAATLLTCLFTAFMAQITGDIAGNRDLWLFSGLLLALDFQRRELKPTDV
jgi:hypothetical protein